ncbi:MAG TPA: chromosomal replication initiator protein DnaA [Candidatus Binataceae bacterium]|nr:chromosomal replication initiator protein DnaA [Candidatus Binataceae bacterium]
MDTIWQGVSNRLRERLGQPGFETWIAPLSFVGIEGQTATLQAPNRFFRDWVNDRYLNDLRQCLSAEIGTDVEIALVPSLPDNGKAAVPAQEAISPRPAESRAAVPAAPGQCRLDARYTFDGFVVGASNQFAHAAAVAVARQPGEKYNPLFLYGAVGLGKTHLATAIGHQLYDSDRARKVVFAPAELFMNELISSLRGDRMSDFKDRMRRVDVLILDDVHFLAGRERTQEEFFHTFNALHAEHHQIVLTSDKAPRDLTGLEERLRNRFESGLIADIAPPDLETRVAILQKKAAAENIALTAEVALFVAQRVTSNVRELEGCFNRLAALASLSQGPITLDLARESLHDLVPDEEVKPDIETIQQRVSEAFHIRLADLKSKSRTQRVAFCRQVAMYLCRNLTDSSFPVIGAGFGRDHSTVIHAYNLIARRVNKDAAFGGLIQKIEKQLKCRRSEPSDLQTP